MGKKTIFLFVLAISIVAVLSILLWPAMYIYDYWDYVCTSYTVSASYEDSNVGYEDYKWQHDAGSVTYYDCGWVDYLIFVDVSSGGGTGWPPEEPDSGQPGGGWGKTQTQNCYDMNNDGFIDCWKNVLIRCNDICINQYFNYTDNCHQGIDFHSCNKKYGVDITGEPVYSATNGTVYAIAQDSTSDAGGWWIEIEADDGSHWTYCHLLEDPRKAVQSSQRVVAGVTIIGNVDSTGNSSGPHLHLQCKVDGVPVNPFGHNIGDC
jgi:hypothetical protein